MFTLLLTHLFSMTTPASPKTLRSLPTKAYGVIILISQMAEVQRGRPLQADNVQHAPLAARSHNSTELFHYDPRSLTS